VSQSPSEPRVVLAVVGAPHGVWGEVRVKTFTDDPEAIGAYGPLSTPDGKRLTVAALRVVKGDLAIARFREITDRTAAEALNRKELTVPRSALPAADDSDTFYHTDLIGLDAVTETGEPLGTVVALHDFGAGDVVEVRGAGGSVLYPFTKAVVPVVDVAAGRVVIVPPVETEAREP
jgi:16S rRNA processing protein RimM